MVIDLEIVVIELDIMVIELDILAIDLFLCYFILGLNNLIWYLIVYIALGFL